MRTRVPTRPPVIGEYVAMDRASGYVFDVPASDGLGRALTGTLAQVWRETRRTADIFIARYEGPEEGAVRIHERGMGWDRHVPSGKAVTYR